MGELITELRCLYRRRYRRLMLPVFIVSFISKREDLTGLAGIVERMIEEGAR